MGSNCIASCSIGCLFCCQGCNAEKLRNAFVFVPPAPSYTVEERRGQTGQPGAGDSTGRGKLVYKPDALRNHHYYRQATDSADVRFLRTAHGERIPVVWLRRSGVCPPAGSPVLCDGRSIVLLHCHGNATDMGMMMGPYLELSNQLDVEVVGVEYSGYGVASGKPSTRNTHTDVEAAYDHVIASGVPPERIVAYGQSVGSGPVLSLASKRKLGGVVLHSPMMSGIKVIDPEPDRCCRPSCMYRCFDFYPNEKRMQSIACPAFIIHGQMDDIIPFYHGAKLAEAAPSEQQWPGYFPAKAGHNDIVEMDTARYYGEVGAFLANVVERSGGTVPGGVAMKPSQVEMATTTFGASTTEDADPGKQSFDVLLPFAEPSVGPEDGRYDKWRRAQGTAPSPASGKT